VDETKLDAGTVPPEDASTSSASNEQAANGHEEPNHGDAGDNLGAKGARTDEKIDEKEAPEDKANGARCCVSLGQRPRSAITVPP
jgi:hypothetical protein